VNCSITSRVFFLASNAFHFMRNDFHFPYIWLYLYDDLTKEIIFFVLKFYINIFPTYILGLLAFSKSFKVLNDSSTYSLHSLLRANLVNQKQIQWFQSVILGF
jgi:hypothetical protein